MKWPDRKRHGARSSLSDSAPAHQVSGNAGQVPNRCISRAIKATTGVTIVHANNDLPSQRPLLSARLGTALANRSLSIGFIQGSAANDAIHSLPSLQE